MNPSKALILGGTGHVGGAVLRALARSQVPCAFTWHTQKDRAHALAAEFNARPVQLDLTDAKATRAALAALRDEGFSPNVLVHCAGVNGPKPLAELTDDDFRRSLDLNVTSAFVAIRELAPQMAAQGQGDVVLVGALDRAQTAAMAAHFAAAQGALTAMAMALAKELGGKGIRVNVVALGLLEGGLAREVNAKMATDFKNFSALRRLGRAEEAANAIRWLALENTYVNGRVVPVNGGV